MSQGVGDSTNLFTQGPSSDFGDYAETDRDRDFAGVSGKNPVGGSRAAGGKKKGDAGLYAEDKSAVKLAGKRSRKPDERLFKYDVVAGRSKVSKISITRDDRMSAEEAGKMLHNIHEKFGVSKENHEVLASFDESLFFCHTVNGASTLGPGRASFGVPDVTEMFPYAAVRDILGVDLRRFFRAFADEISEANRRVLRDHDPFDVESHEQWGWLMQVAQERQLTRYPWLAHDSADACNDLTVVERQALAESKVGVIGSTVNSADRMKTNARTVGADRYDSSTGQVV